MAQATGGLTLLLVEKSSWYKTQQIIFLLTLLLGLPFYENTKHFLSFKSLLFFHVQDPLYPGELLSSKSSSEMHCL